MRKNERQIRASLTKNCHFWGDSFWRFLAYGRGRQAGSNSLAGSVEIGKRDEPAAVII